ncbi:MAG: HEAT repeat domain-containing protein [Bacillota bacterium]
MRPGYFIAVLISLVYLSASDVSARNFTNSASSLENNFSNRELIENNLFVGLESDNLGLRISSAQFLGEYKSSRATIPLMRMLHNDKDENARIQAAWSLMKIGDGRGIFMVKQAARFDDSPRVKRICRIFYNSLSEK